MGKNAAQLRVAGDGRTASDARIVDMRTRQPWRPPEPKRRSLLLDVGLVFCLAAFGAWVFLRMHGG